MLTDNISDMLTRIRNAILVRHQIVQVPNTKINLLITEILKKEGYILDFEKFKANKKNYLLIKLKYQSQNNKLSKPIINVLKRISKPGLRIYVNHKNIPSILNNLGIAILSTSKGVITNHTARTLGIGGELICYIW
jgi:small subunit ribosomal protein S8